MIFDWREFSGRPTWDWSDFNDEIESSFLTSDQDKSLAKEWKVGGVWLGGLNKDELSISQSSQPSSAIVIQPQNVLRPLNRGDERVVPLNPNEELEGEVREKDKKQVGLKSWEWNMSQDPARRWAIAFAWIAAGFAE